MNPDLANFAARLRESISLKGAAAFPDFNALALELFALQFRHNSAYRRVCESRGVAPHKIEQWTQIPAIPTLAFKELELTSLPPSERTAVFHSSGTTEQKPSRHFHSMESLAVYEASLWSWFEPNFLDGALAGVGDAEWLFLTPPPAQTPHSSLIHMFETVRRKVDVRSSVFAGHLDLAGAWMLDYDRVLSVLEAKSKSKLILGTAFSFVQLLDYLAANDLRFQLPPGSRVMETGGYKNRSRTMPKTELHALIAERLGVGRDHIICEYGMSELSSQAYDSVDWSGRMFQFPSWARARIISPETGREVSEGETGLIRILDLANIFSVAAVQTEDLGVRRGDGFELAGRAAAAEARGCSLMTA